MRRKIVAGNWKMNTTHAEATALASAVVHAAAGHPKVGIAIFPPFPWLLPVREILKGSAVVLGAQNCHYEKSGAFTGEVSPQMLVDAGCHAVIIGHSERRHGLGETDALLNKKAKAALAAGLKVIFCVGELLAEREANQTEAVLDRQATEGLRDLPMDKLGNLVLAYEPVWAIGTGKVATPEQAQAAHAFLRKKVTAILGENPASLLPILYGGSVTPETASGLFAQGDVDGGLVGGASLKADAFAKIIAAAG
ncbi:MAG TPA: triose-phosphate isomerase [Urbifossiella sp.]|nr:triose-phosphate isomerase [Urbifossiella sp.]